MTRVLRRRASATPLRAARAVPHVPLDLEHDGAPSRKLALVAVQPSAISLHHLRPPSTDHASSSSSSWGLVSRRSWEHAGESTSRLMRTFADHPRGFLSVALEPLRKHWLAATDSLGRVSVFEAKALVCVRLFKGYRDAQIGWTDAASAGAARRPWAARRRRRRRRAARCARTMRSSSSMRRGVAYLRCGEHRPQSASLPATWGSIAFCCPHRRLLHLCRALLPTKRSGRRALRVPIEE